MKPENFILKVIDSRISSNKGREIATEKTYKPRPVFEETRYTFHNEPNPRISFLHCSKIEQLNPPPNRIARDRIKQYE